MSNELFEIDKLYRSNKFDKVVTKTKKLIKKRYILSFQKMCMVLVIKDFIVKSIK